MEGLLLARQLFQAVNPSFNFAICSEFAMGYLSSDLAEAIAMP
jgi:hypothetical protein